MAQEKNDRIVCLFGSGVSIPAGMPSTQELTEKLIPPRDFGLNRSLVYERGCTDECWASNPLPQIFGNPARWTPLISEIVSALAVLIGEGLMEAGLPEGRLTYEDVMYACRKMSELDEEDTMDPLAAVARARLRSQVRPELKNDMNTLLGKARSCIGDLLWQELRDRPIGCIDALQFIGEMVDALNGCDISVITLNHDCVLEKYLRDRPVSFTDGFSEPGDESDLATYDGRLLDTDGVGVRVFKLHGSINWFELGPVGSSFGHRIVSGTLQEVEDWCDPRRDGADWTIEGNRPILIVGTHNKTTSYTMGMHAELFCRARNALMRARKLLICGYGFRDPGVNTMLWNWGFEDQDRTMVVIHRNPQELRGEVSAEVLKRLDALEEVRILRWIPKFAGDSISWKRDLKPHFSPTKS